MLEVSSPPSLNVTGFGGFGGPPSSKLPTAPNAAPSSDEEIAALKLDARAQAIAQIKKMTTVQMARSARVLYQHGSQERTGDAKQALVKLIKMSQIMATIMDTATPHEFREAMKDWPAYDQDLTDSKRTMEALEAKIKNDSENSGVKSIEERLKALRANGLQVSSKQTKRAPQTPTPPPVQTPTSSGNSRRLSAPPSPLKPPIAPPELSLPSVPLFAHSLVPTTTLGDSPLSSPSNSPLVPHSGLASMPEVDDYHDAEASYPSIGQFELDHPSPNPNIFTARRFDPVERAASVPPAPSYSSMLPSRPASPTKPSLHRKQSIIATSIAKPKSSASPEDLMIFKNSKTIHTLLIDVRTRAEFDKEHIINDQAIICIEPIVLNRSNLTADALENALELNPKAELTLFQNRHIFEYVIIYDQNSTTPSLTMKSLMNAIFVNSVHGKMLKHPPMLLVGGLDAVKRQYGDTAVSNGPQVEQPYPSVSATSTRPTHPDSFSMPMMSPSLNGIMSPQLNGNETLSKEPMSPTFAALPMEPTQLWSAPARSRPDTTTTANASPHNPFLGHRGAFSVDQGSNHTRSPAEINYTGRRADASQNLTRRPALSRPPTSSGPGPSSFAYPANGVTYPTPMGGARMSPATTGTEIASPAPVTLTRRRSDYMEQPSFNTCGSSPSFNASSPAYPTSSPVSYPVPSSNSVANIARPLPAAVPGTDTRPREMSLSYPTKPPPVIPPKPQLFVQQPRNIFPYWSDVEIGLTGLRNMGNTCYMNSAVQCLSATMPFARFFTDGRWKSEVNKYALRPGASKASKEFLDGKTSFLFSNVLRTLWGSDLPYIVPTDIWSHMASQFEGFNNKRQHDAGEWMGNLLSLLSVELNRVTDPDDGSRPDQWFLDLATKSPAESNYKAWEKELMKENSIVFDCFGSLTRTMRQCQRCMKKSPSYLSNTILPLTFLPKYGSSRLTPRQCFESIFQTEEDMTGGNKWLCPVCKSLQDAKATTRLARAPPVLLIQLSRYEDASNGKKKNHADFPLRDLDISEWMVTLDPEICGPGADDARAQRAPYRYDLYAVVNHDGQTIDSGHYTSMILSGGKWKECNDSIIRNVSNSEVVTPKAYILCYKRRKT